MDLKDIIFTKALFSGGENVPEWDGSYVVSGGGGGGDWFGDGNTHIWVSLQEGRTSLWLRVCPNGIVTVDWGDGTTPDVLRGSNDTTAQQRTPVHNYASAGEYVITLTVNGTLGMIGSGGNSYGYLLSVTKAGAQLTDIVALNSIKKIEFGNGVRNIGNYALGECRSLKRIRLPNGLTNIGERAFYGCSALEAISVPNSVVTIGRSAFYECSSLEEINLPDGITDIGPYMCYKCYALTSITIPNEVTTIGDYAFHVCRVATKISIPKNVTSIGSQAFGSCCSVVKIRFEGTTPPTVSSNTAFFNFPTDCIISVPVGSLEAYKTATNYPDPNTYTYVEE